MDGQKYQCLGVAFQAYKNCIVSNDFTNLEKWETVINDIVESLPTGSGIDGETTFDFEKSKVDKLIINSEFHFMDNNGFYDGWGTFRIIISPDWRGFNMNVSCKFPKKYKMILQDYLYDTFSYDLEQPYKIAWEK